MKKQNADITLDELDLSVRTRNCLQAENCRTLGDAAAKTEGELLRVPNFGRKSLRELDIVLKQYGLHFGWQAPPRKTSLKEDLAKLGSKEDLARLASEIAELRHEYQNLRREFEKFRDKRQVTEAKLDRLVETVCASHNSLQIAHNFVQGILARVEGHLADLKEERERQIRRNRDISIVS